MKSKVIIHQNKNSLTRSSPPPIPIYIFKHKYKLRLLYYLRASRSYFNNLLNSSKMAVGKIIATIRKSKRLKQKELAEQTNIPVTVLSKIENEKLEPGMGHLKKIAKSLGIPAEILMLVSLNPNSIPEHKRKDFQIIRDMAAETFITKNK